jgi:hypothetical protein
MGGNQVMGFSSSTTSLTRGRESVCVLVEMTDLSIETKLLMTLYAVKLI